MKPCAHKHSHERQEMAALTGRLRNQSRKITGPRAAILEILRQHPHPLTNKEIFAEMPKGQCDLATIYRSMHLLEKMGMVKRFDFGDGTAIGVRAAPNLIRPAPSPLLQDRSLKLPDSIRC